MHVDDQLERVHWHLVRGDQLRAGVSARAGAVLSTNALVLAGIALAFSLRSPRPDALVVAIALGILGCVALSVGNATLALVTLRSWERQFGDRNTPTAFLYCHVEADQASSAFKDFRRRVTTMSPEEHLDHALAELWRCGRLHGYRYRRLRIAVCWLLAALVLFPVAAAAAI
ncbi:hypothetical protein DPM19_21340 [Actinomadura craniellae]|uniref:Pycsar effector protein domain-containing protein n=1 Tax=Actinomadura craniellae TaxID=2231787 RepID=A0A365H1S8_9ACTN|nr:hypothetical protein [Actinomadura craniellae]RAY13051.1 hypothetical protein DPM19_21340 [Actinomadura craniellae]